ncbi:MAG: L,D-transpeptidase family protein [Candidatus Omnitrophota bacterium]|nr:MAG: L,D-transpeptidase family protein [Candidatus Omnitrophota bacterium]
MRRGLITIIIGIVALILLVSMIKGKGPAGTEGRAGSPTNYLKQASLAFEEEKYVEARQFYKNALEVTKDVGRLKMIQKRIEELNMKIMFSTAMDDCSVKYVVKSGDNLSRIAKKHNTTVGLIKRANGLDSDIIIPYQKLKITNCKFSVVVDKSQNILFLKRGDEVIKTYVVSTGKDNSTPVGTFKIVNKLINPTWYKTGAVIPPDSSENILGSRWMGFDLKGYGIHGTTEPKKLGKQITLGCVRMRNKEVEELYDIVPKGTEVTIVD